MPIKYLLYLIIKYILSNIHFMYIVLYISITQKTHTVCSWIVSYYINIQYLKFNLGYQASKSILVVDKIFILSLVD